MIPGPLSQDQVFFILFYFILFYFILFYFYFIYFWPHWVFVAAHGLSLVVVSGGYSLLQCAGFSLQWLLLLWRTGSRCTGFSSCGTRASVVAPRHVGSSWTRARTRVPCIGRRILNHCTTREGPDQVFITGGSGKPHHGTVPVPRSTDVHFTHLE